MDTDNSQTVDSHGLIPVSLLESWTEQLLIHSERDELYESFIAFVSDIYQPKKLQSFTNKEQSLTAHRQYELADISVFDSRDADKKRIVLSELPEVHRTIVAKIPRFEITPDSQQRSLYIPLLSGEVVTDVLVLNHIELSDAGRLIWPSLYKSYEYLNNTLYLAEIDPLTGLMNRLKFEKLVTRALSEVKGSTDEEDGAFFAVVDVDFFKKINDTFGHLYGDEVLVLLARYMTESFRSFDWLFRYGGEEFVIILRNETNEGAIRALERFRHFIEQTAFPQMETGQVTVSIGYSQMQEFDAVSSLIDRADLALYYVKNHGRNQVANYEALVEQGLLESKEQQADIELF